MRHSIPLYSEFKRAAKRANFRVSRLFFPFKLYNNYEDHEGMTSLTDSLLVLSALLSKASFLIQF